MIRLSINGTGNLTSGRAYTNEPKGGAVETSPFNAVVRNSRMEVAWIVMRRWILVSGAFGRGKESSMGRADESTVLSVSFAIFLPDCENVVLSVVGRGALGKFYWMFKMGSLAPSHVFGSIQSGLRTKSCVSQFQNSISPLLCFDLIVSFQFLDQGQAYFVLMVE